jgi:hypothetical protein
MAKDFILVFNGTNVQVLFLMLPVFSRVLFSMILNKSNNRNYTMVHLILKIPIV